MKKILLILTPVLFLSACYSEEDDDGNRILNPGFQKACIESGGTVYPTRYGYGGCVIDGYSYNKVNGIRMIN